MREKTIENHPNCPKCGSKNTEIQVYEGACPCHGRCWSRPVCLDCGHEGWANSDGIYWNEDD